MCDPCLIGLDLLNVSECEIDLAQGVMQMGLEELHLGGVSTDDKVELEAPESMTIPPGVEARVPAQWRARPTWQEHCGLVEQMAGRPIQGLALRRTLVIKY